MMTLHTLLTFIAAVTVMMLIPGPNVALITAQSVAHGWRCGLLTVAGTASAMALQLLCTWAGLSALLGDDAKIFAVIRWAGAAYLIWLGLRQMFAPALARTKTPPVARGVFWRGVLVSLTNPKTLFFYAALFPQFVRPGAGASGEVAWLAAVFLSVALIVDSGWVFAAQAASHWLGRHGRLRQRISGAAMAGTGVALAVIRVK